jgi:hypothetical protein
VLRMKIQFPLRERYHLVTSLTEFLFIYLPLTLPLRLPTVPFL